MKLNNKGFAITSVLYGLLLLFVFLVSSYLLVLTSKKNRLDTISDDIEDKYGFNTEIEIISPFSTSTSYTAPYTGKYVFLFSDNSTCSSYIKKGTNISNDFSNVTLIGTCNSSNTITAIEIWYNDLGSGN